ncbi:hypothetical protein C0J52_14535 [Blattella germanica]|nr:hypothetical protein C0J52_14535 [Blattella germanica]
MGVVDKNGRKLVAPDGGWGWVIVIAVSIINLSTRSIEPSFGLLFGDKLRDLGVHTTGASLITSAFDATINFSGLFVGPLIKQYSYRKIAILGSLLSALGLTLTFPAASMAHILTTYSIIGGLGVGFAWSSTFVALNHYFSKRRGQAIGLSMVGTGIGMMLFPQVVQVLLAEYNFYGAVLILGAISFHSLPGSLTLQPIRWHLKPEEEKKTPESDTKEIEAQSPLLEKPKEASSLSPPEDVEKQEVLGGRKRSQQLLRIVSSNSMSAKKRKESVISNISNDNKNHPEPEKQAPETKESFWHRIVVFMDLDLLKDPIFLNILFGLSIFYVAELNYKMIVPFFLDDLGYTKKDIAFFLSMTAASDIVARLVLPPICDRLKIKRRVFFAIGCIFLGLSRSVLAEQKEYTEILIALIVNGFFRGATLINFMLTISEYCSLEKLPAAFGLHMVGKGLFIVAFGPVLGVIRDETDSYPFCIHTQTMLIAICILAWGLEFVLTRKSSKPNQEKT